MPAKPYRKAAGSKSKRAGPPIRSAMQRRQRRSTSRIAAGDSGGPSLIDKQLVASAWLQAIGTNLAAIGQSKSSLSDRKTEREEGNRLITLGNTLQAISNAAQAELILKQGLSESNQLNAFGSLLQALGEALQVFISLTDPGTDTRGSLS